MQEFILSRIDQEKTPAIRSGDGQSETLPLFRGAMKAEEVLYLILCGKAFLSIGTVKIDQ